ncbi:MAG TPA: glycosyltransferase, partial [Chthonomonadaceae bacterium]|nr:glycosyltransferase [Chthonomonadaceae bacterium]
MTKALGASKPILELAEELRELGWTCDTLGPDDFSIVEKDRSRARRRYAESLRAYLAAHAAEYDIVDYSHEYLPFPRAEFCASTLFVARSVLLAHHLETARIPIGRDVKTQIGALLKGPSRRRERRQMIASAQETVRNADLVNVTNDDDRDALIRCGIPAEKIVVLPFGISRSRRPLFDAVSSGVPEKPVVAFVGTFDYRKGAREFPTIAQNIVAAVPEARFRLLGT